MYFENRRFATPPTPWAPPSYEAEGGYRFSKYMSLQLHNNIIWQ
jgi:hypothetical protein